MTNIFLNKAISSMLNMPSEQVDALMKAVDKFKSSEIDRKLALELFNKLSKKTPQEINTFMKFINDSVS